MFAGITPDVFRTLSPDAAAAALRENWFPASASTSTGRPTECAAFTTASGPTKSIRKSVSGGMAVVFLATDTTEQRVALRTVPSYTAPDVLAAEHRGAELQEQFCRVSGFVPQVYSYGTEADYFYVAMEYLDGENLSQAIRRGPLPETRAVAVAIELCRFLEDARGFT
jgi:aminoglycoside phosphotransferase (APT) family kinase protein